ncbi:MSMEG_0565 family glycosyltransferase [Paraburkholderia sp.]|uniref:MSMEG_0565 family glycosyltransferase n=1 Tax=Paraburkholderia sp. TaxID=1926495 RepID=UPI003D6DA904
MSAASLRVALFTHSVNPRGGVVHTLELARALHRQGHDVTVFAPAAHGERMFRETPCRVVLANVAPLTYESHCDGAARLAATIDARIVALKTALRVHGADHFDVLHAQDSISGNALAEFVEEGAIRGFVRTVHHLDDFDDPRLAAWQRRAYREADVVLCVSDAWTRHLRDTFDIVAQTVPNGVDAERYRHASHAGLQHEATLRTRFGIHGHPVVLAVGGIEARKNTLMLLDAFAQLRASHAGAQLVIAGGASLLDHDDYGRRFIERASQHRLAIGPGEPVVVTGPLDDAAMPGVFRIADVVPMVSVREGFGLVVLEALASGKPVVVSAIEPFTDYLCDDMCCWADPADAGSIARALVRALSPDSGIDFAHAVPALLQRFTWTASAARHAEIYRRWLCRQPAATH